MSVYITSYGVHVQLIHVEETFTLFVNSKTLNIIQKDGLTHSAGLTQQC